MGTPVPSKIREHEYSEKETEPEVVKRQLTEEERKYYDSLAKPKKKAVYIYPEDEDLYINQREDGEEMPKRIEAPSKEELTELCKKYPGKYRASVGIAEHYGISRSTVERWILDNGLKGLWDQPDSKDKKSRDIEECKPVKGEKPTKEQLEKLCKNYPNIYQASCAIGSIYGVHRTTVSNWIKGYGIEALWEKKQDIPKKDLPPSEELMQEAEQEGCSEEPDQDTKEFDRNIKDKFGRFDYISEGTNSETSEEFQLTNKMYRFGTLDIDVQYDRKRVVIFDSETVEEIEIPFAKANAFADNMKKIGDEVEGGKA